MAESAVAHHTTGTRRDSTDTAHTRRHDTHDAILVPNTMRFPSHRVCGAVGAGIDPKVVTRQVSCDGAAAAEGGEHKVASAASHWSSMPQLYLR